MANINLHNVSEMEEQLLLAKNDLVAFGKLFLPDDFMRSESPFFHYEVCDALNDLDTAISRNFTEGPWQDSSYKMFYYA